MAWQLIGNIEGPSGTGVELPIGSIIAWAGRYYGDADATLPAGFVRCDGQLISDAGSPYNGKFAPDLNSTGSNGSRFLRGAGIGLNAPFSYGGQQISFSTGSFCQGSCNAGSNCASGCVNGTNLPPFMDVTWIMRIK